MKHKDRQYETDIEKRTAFSQNLNRLFDIAHQDALSLMKNQEDREFLISQRQDTKKGYMDKVDKDLAEKEEIIRQRAEAEHNRKRKAEIELQNFYKKVPHQELHFPEPDENFGNLS